MADLQVFYVDELNNPEFFNIIQQILINNKMLTQTDLKVGVHRLLCFVRKNNTVGLGLSNAGQFKINSRCGAVVSWRELVCWLECHVTALNKHLMLAIMMPGASNKLLFPIQPELSGKLNDLSYDVLSRMAKNIAQRIIACESELEARTSGPSHGGSSGDDNGDSSGDDTVLLEESRLLILRW